MLTNASLIRKELKEIMSKLDDVKAAVAANTAKVDQVGTSLAAFIAANSGGATDADLEPVLSAVNASNTVLDTVIAELTPTPTV